MQPHSCPPAPTSSPHHAYEAGSTQGCTSALKYTISQAIHRVHALPGGIPVAFVAAVMLPV